MNSVQNQLRKCHHLKCDIDGKCMCSVSCADSVTKQTSFLYIRKGLTYLHIAGKSI